MQPRTKRQKEVLDYITRFVDRNGYEPSYQQIARQLGVTSKGGIQRHIVALENQGLIARRRENGSFGIELRSRKMVAEAVVNIELIETDGGSHEVARPMITVPKFLVGSLSPADVVAFRAADDSMEEKHLCEGDIVLFEKRSYARRGQVVLAAARGKQILLGLYFHHGLETEIRPASANVDGIFFPADEIEVLGVMRALLRPFPSEDQEHH